MTRLNILNDAKILKLENLSREIDNMRDFQSAARLFPRHRLFSTYDMSARSLH